jgi:peptide/nickel transport system substrate-binding protein
MLIALLEACAGGNSPISASNPKPVRGGHLTEGTPSDVTGLNGVIDSGLADVVIGNMFDGLLGFTPTGELAPLLAKTLPSVSADGTTYTFTLRPDIKWSDGHPLLADDVVFTYKLMYHADYKAVRSPYRGDMQKVLASVVATSPTTVVMTTQSVNAAFLTNHGRHFILPQHILGQLTPTAMNAAPFNTSPSVVSGPFKFVEWAKGDHLTLARNDTCYRGAPYLDKWVWKNVSDGQPMLNALKTGEIDVAKFHTWGLLDDVLSSPILAADIFPIAAGTRYIYQLDPSKPASKIFGDTAVRQALASAVDRDGMTNAIYFKAGASAAYSQVPPISWAYSASVKPKYGFDTKKAAAMLDAAGWKVGGSGVREKNGVQMKFQILAPVESPEFSQTAQVLQHNWKALGIDAQVGTIPYVQVLAKVSTTRDFDMVIYPMTNQGYPDPDLSAQFKSDNTAIGGLNGGGYRNPALDELLAAAAGTIDRAKRRDLYYKVQDILNNDVPSVPVNIWNGFWIRNKRVQNFSYPTGMGPAIYSSARPVLSQVFVTDGK